MNTLTLNDLLLKVSEYNNDEKDLIKKAYAFAEEIHRGQKRQSGEDYIQHPLNVAYILADMHADTDTICAGLLHDTIEDAREDPNVVKQHIIDTFNGDIGFLADGVTKIRRMNFLTKQDQNMANKQKLLVSMAKDIRVIIIKLADRLHNMRTLQYKSEFKQKENAAETLSMFVPFAYYIGAYIMKNELEDLSFRYLKPEEYKRMEELRQKIDNDSNRCLIEMLSKINEILNDNNIPHEIKVRTKNIYGIYKRLQQGYRLADIHDLLSLKIMVNDILNCYQTLGLVHLIYHPIPRRFKDYICNPKTNLYSSLHTTVFGADERLVQTQIRTFEMDKIASYGLTAYWDIHKGNAREVMQEELKNKFQFYESLDEILHMSKDTKIFINQVKSELLNDKIYVYTPSGEKLELPKNATPIDVAYRIHSEIGNTMVSATVNENKVDIGQTLKTDDIVRIITDRNAEGPKEEWLNYVTTAKAKRKIKEAIRKA